MILSRVFDIVRLLLFSLVETLLVTVIQRIESITLNGMISQRGVLLSWCQYFYMFIVKTWSQGCRHSF